MKLQYLFQTAKQLRPPSGPAAAEFEASRDGLAASAMTTSESSVWRLATIRMPFAAT